MPYASWARASSSRNAYSLIRRRPSSRSRTIFCVPTTRKTGTTLGDFDVLGQLAEAGGSLRMTELADRTLSSRSSMTRRIDRMVDEGVVRRAGADGDARGVVVALTDAGVTRLAETAPVHLRGVSELFVERLDDQELAALETALDKVTLDCTFG